MSLATRCPACHTVFRVVQDQLRVSEGWVRCGQCQEVFNALETLFDLDTEPAALPPVGGPQPAAWSPTPPASRSPHTFAGADMPPAVPPPTSAHPASPLQPPPSDSPSLPSDPAVPTAPPPRAESAAMPPAHRPDDDAAPAEWEEHPRPEDHWDPADQATLPMSLEALAASYRDGHAASTGWPDDEPASPPTVPVGIAATTAPRDALAPVPTALPTAAPEDDDDPQAPTPSRFIGPSPDWARTPAPRERRKKKSRRAPADAHAQPHVDPGAHRRRRKPEFVRQAERAAQWRRPMVRAVLGVAAITLALMLAGQVGYHQRDQLAARVPALAPSLHAGCAWLGCRVGAPRALERIRLDASDLTRTGQDQVLRFVADLRNTADHAVRTPALDLSLTDAAGQVVSRKVLLPAELGARDEAIAAEGQWRVDARLAVGELRVSGYTVEVFYP